MLVFKVCWKCRCLFSLSVFSICAESCKSCKKNQIGKGVESPRPDYGHGGKFGEVPKSNIKVNKGNFKEPYILSDESKRLTDEEIEGNFSRLKKEMAERSAKYAERRRKLNDDYKKRQEEREIESNKRKIAEEQKRKEQEEKRKQKEAEEENNRKEQERIEEEKKKKNKEEQRRKIEEEEKRRRIKAEEENRLKLNDKLKAEQEAAKEKSLRDECLTLIQNIKNVQCDINFDIKLKVKFDDINVYDIKYKDLLKLKNDLIIKLKNANDILQKCKDKANKEIEEKKKLLNEVTTAWVAVNDLYRKLEEYGIKRTNSYDSIVCSSTSQSVDSIKTILADLTKMKNDAEVELVRCEEDAARKLEDEKKTEILLQEANSIFSSLLKVYKDKLYPEKDRKYKFQDISANSPEAANKLVCDLKGELANANNLLRNLREQDNEKKTKAEENYKKCII